MTKQEAMFRLALQEEGLPTDNIRIDHAAGKCWQGDTEYPVVFPQSWVDRLRPLRPFRWRYAFEGMKTSRRDWLESYQYESQSRIVFTERGRNIPKDFCDDVYYEHLRSAKFALCPDGDVPWTYRFIEACFCRTIPCVVSPTGQMDGYKVIELTDTKAAVYSEADAEHNYQRAIARHTIRGLNVH